MTNASPVRTRKRLETHVQTVLLAMVIAVITWSGNTTLKLIETTARQDERITQLLELTEELRQELRDAGNRFMTIDAADFYRQQVNGRLDALDDRVKRLEGK